MPNLLGGIRGASLLEQRIGDAAVAVGKCDFAFATTNFGFEEGNPFFEFGH